MIGLIEKFASPWFFEVGRMDAAPREEYYKAWLASFSKTSRMGKKLRAANSEYEIVGFVPGVLTRDLQNKLALIAFKEPTCFFMHRKLAGGAFVTPGGTKFSSHPISKPFESGLMRSNPRPALSWVSDVEILSDRGWREYLRDSVSDLRSSKLTPERLASESKDRNAASFKPFGGLVNLVYTRAKGEPSDLSLGEGMLRRAILYIHAFAGPGYAFESAPLESIIMMRPGLRFNKSVLSEVGNTSLETGLEGVSG